MIKRLLKQLRYWQRLRQIKRLKLRWTGQHLWIDGEKFPVVERLDE